MTGNIHNARNDKWMYKSSFRFRNNPLPHATPVSGTAVTPTTASSYWGWNFVAGAGGATIKVYDGTTASGLLIDTIVLAANAASSQMYASAISLLSNSCFYTVTAGSATGNVRVS